MDGDPAVEPELDAFSLILPLPYRIAVIVVLGMLTLRDHVAKLMSLRYMGLGCQPSLLVSHQNCTLISCKRIYNYAKQTSYRMY